MKNNIMVGKYTLESLTTGMYIDPFIIYREYIQNSTDSIDEAVKKGFINYDQSKIQIDVDNKENRIIIEDNGIGISSSNSYKVLTDIGNSTKKISNNRGFRGIGRLGGLSYCKRLVFETSYPGESEKSIVIFDAVKLSELLVPGKYEEYSMTDVINEATSFNKKKECSEKHYFKVTLEGVIERFKLTHLERVEEYLIQVAPIPFDLKKFKHGGKLNNRLNELNINEVFYNIYLGKTENEFKQIFKPYKTRFLADMNKKIIDEIKDIDIKEIRNDYEGKIIALVWYGKCNLLGTVLDNRVKGFRMRKSGILVSDRFLLNKLFKEERFNGWIQGEIIVLDENIIPNARRDDFEKNDAYLYLLEQLKDITKEISNEIREESRKRTNQKLGKNKNIVIKDQQKDISKMDLLRKMDILIDKINISNQNTLSKIEIIIREEINERAASNIIERIEKLIS